MAENALIQYFYDAPAPHLSPVTTQFDMQRQNIMLFVQMQGQQGELFPTDKFILRE